MKTLQLLAKELNVASEYLKDFNKFKHLFSDDDAEKQLAELRRTIGQISLNLKLSQLKEIGHPTNKALESKSSRNGLVKIRPCADKYNNKTYLGFYIGDIALGSSISIEENKIICEFDGHNPAIYVPELNKIIYGAESWWGKINTPEEIKDISDDDIQNVWYVKLLKKIKDK